MRTPLGFHRVSLRSHRTKPAESQTDRDLLSTLLNAEAYAPFLDKNEVVYAGTVVVVDSANRKLEQYKLGDLIGFTGSGQILDRPIVQIAAIERKYHSLRMSLSYVLPNYDRELSAIQTDLRNR